MALADIWQARCAIAAVGLAWAQLCPAVQAMALADLRRLEEPAAHGELPLLNRDPATPNDACFVHVDHVISRQRLGLAVGLNNMWQTWAEAHGFDTLEPRPDLILDEPTHDAAKIRPADGARIIV